jgi:hypothetical protein
MPCANKTYSSTIVGSQTSLEKGEIELTVPESKSKKYRNEIKPRIIRDHAHTDPEHVWGDEGPIND